MHLNNQETEKFTYDVFISHSSKDKPAVRELAQRLKDDGLRVWFDEWEIKPGDMIGLKIEQGLEQSRTLVLVMSANAFASDWVTLERHTAMFRDPTNALRRFIPLRLDDAEIKDTLKQFAYVDWRQKSDEHYAKLLTGIQPLTKTSSEQKGGLRPSKILKGHTNEIWGVALTMNGRRMVSCFGDKTLRVWDMESGKCIAILAGHSNRVFAVAVTPDGRIAVSGSLDKTVRLWNLAARKCIATLKGHTSTVWGVAVTPDGKKAISSSHDDTLRVWDIETRKCLGILEPENELDSPQVYDVAMAADGKRAISAHQDSFVRLWNLDSMKCVNHLIGHSKNVYGLALKPDGKRAISGSGDNTMRVWDLDSGKCEAILEGHTNSVRSIAITPDGKRAISSSDDNTMRVWDLDSGKCDAIIENQTTRRTVAITPDGKRAISILNKIILVWELPESGVSVEPSTSTRYTNAKVALVGETGVGKTGLALRLCDNRWEPTESTQGMLVSQIKLPSDVS